MNRHYTQFQYALEKDLVHLYAKVAIGAAGAPTLTAASSKGISGFTRTSAGLYVMTLADKYRRLVFVSNQQIVSAVPSAAPVFNIVSEDVAGAKTITMQFSAATNATTTTLIATDPTNGATELFHVVLSRTSAI